MRIIENISRVYVAKDGQSFVSRDMCEKYEQSLIEVYLYEHNHSTLFKIVGTHSGISKCLDQIVKQIFGKSTLSLNENNYVVETCAFESLNKQQFLAYITGNKSYVSFYTLCVPEYGLNLKLNKECEWSHLS